MTKYSQYTVPSHTFNKLKKINITPPHISFIKTQRKLWKLNYFRKNKSLYKLKCYRNLIEHNESNYYYKNYTDLKGYRKTKTIKYPTNKYNTSNYKEIIDFITIIRTIYGVSFIKVCNNYSIIKNTIINLNIPKSTYSYCINDQEYTAIKILMNKFI